MKNIKVGNIFVSADRCKILMVTSIKKSEWKDNEIEIRYKEIEVGDYEGVSIYELSMEYDDFSRSFLQLLNDGIFEKVLEWIGSAFSEKRSLFLNAPMKTETELKAGSCYIRKADRKEIVIIHTIGKKDLNCSYIDLTNPDDSNGTINYNISDFSSAYSETEDDLYIKAQKIEDILYHKVKDLLHSLELNYVEDKA